MCERECVCVCVSACVSVCVCLCACHTVAEDVVPCSGVLCPEGGVEEPQQAWRQVQQRWCRG